MKIVDYVMYYVKGYEAGSGRCHIKLNFVEVSWHKNEL